MLVVSATTQSRLISLSTFLEQGQTQIPAEPLEAVQEKHQGGKSIRRVKVLGLENEEQAIAEPKAGFFS